MSLTILMTAPQYKGGLTAAEVAASRALHGANVLTPPAREPWWSLYFEKYNDPVIRILLVAAGLAIAAGIYDGSYVEGAGILCAVVLSTSLGFFNEYKAAREFEALNQVSDEQLVRVLRDAKKQGVPRRDIVVGDFVFVETGVEIPADGTVLHAVELFVDESKQTGESNPVRKCPAVPVMVSAAPLPADNDAEIEAQTYPPEKVLRGTLVSSGNGVLRIDAVGAATEAGQSATAAVEHVDKQTPLTRQLERLAKVIGVFGFAAAAALFLALVVRALRAGELNLNAAQWRVVALAAAALAVAMAPVWGAILGDAWELFRGPGARKRPEGKLWHWLLALALGAGILALGLWLLVANGWLPANRELWIPRDAARRFLDYFMIAVTVIVVAVPEGLAMSVTLCIAYTMRRMMATHTLVRRMFACETIGAVTVICSDKTGTLTLNQMRVQEADFPALADPSGRTLIQTAIAANSTADLGAKEKPDERVLGNATEGALLLWLEQQRVDYARVRSTSKVLKQLPFSTEHKVMCTLVASADGGGVLHVKGAPEVLLERCAQRRTAAGVEALGAERAGIEARIRAFQTRGMRTLAFVYREVSAAEAQQPLEQLARGLIWLGSVGILDPVREEVPAAIQACRRAGIRVKIVTGDTSRTAFEIARQIGMLAEQEPPGAHITGADFAALDDARANAAAHELKVMSRARPADKLRLVKLLKAQGEIVGVTGDGSNDAPALNHANVGLAMGRSGTAIAREASDIVLLDDSFTSIVNAVKWGRSLYKNIQSFIVFQLTINVAALGLALIGPFVGVTLPLTVMQMLWINLIMDTLAALALSSEPPHDSVMDVPPRSRDEFIITRAMTLNIFTAGLLFLAAMIALLIYYQRDGELSRHELTVVFTVLVLLQFWNLFNARCFGRAGSALHGILENKGFVAVALSILIGQFVVVQWGGNLFRTEPLSVREWALILGGTSVVMWVGEVARRVRPGRPKHVAPGAAV